MPLSKHVYCVAVAFKMTEQVEQWICIKFCFKLEHSSAETIWMLQKATAMGTWWLIVSFLMTMCPLLHHVLCRGFGGTSNHPCDSVPLQPRFCTPRLLAFPKTKITFEREEISDQIGFRKIWWGSWQCLGELCEVPRCPLWRRLRHHCPVYNVTCSFNNYCYFQQYMLGTFWTDLIYQRF